MEIRVLYCFNITSYYLSLYVSFYVIIPIVNAYILTQKERKIRKIRLSHYILALFGFCDTDLLLHDVTLIERIPNFYKSVKFYIYKTRIEFLVTPTN